MTFPYVCTCKYSRLETSKQLCTSQVGIRPRSGMATHESFASHLRFYPAPNVATMQVY